MWPPACGTQGQGDVVPRVHSKELMDMVTFQGLEKLGSSWGAPRSHKQGTTHVAIHTEPGNPSSATTPLPEAMQQRVLQGSDIDKMLSRASKKAEILGRGGMARACTLCPPAGGDSAPHST